MALRADNALEMVRCRSCCRMYAFGPDDRKPTLCPDCDGGPMNKWADSLRILDGGKYAVSANGVAFENKRKRKKRMRIGGEGE